jgi:tripartite ATP-independent transporter DctP family solute receptor
MIMRFLRYATLSAALISLIPSTASAQTKELQLAHIGGPGSLFEITANEFARRANEKLPAGYRVVAVGDSKLGSDEAVMAKIQKGEVAFGLPSTVMSSVSPKFGVFELPFLIRNREQVSRISDALLEPVLQPEVRAKGYRILAIWENGFRQITSNARPVKTPADLANMKLRVPKGDWRIKTFEALGAKPVPMQLDTTYDAIKSGAVDGQENPLAQIKGTKFDEVQRYLTLSDHVYTPAYLITSDKHFAELPADVQEILKSTSVRMRSWIFAKAVQIEGELLDGLDGLASKMQTNQIDVKAFRAASRPVYNEFIRTVPGGARLILTVAELAEVPTAEYSGP